jgi:hypothetical protein
MRSRHGVIADLLWSGVNAAPVLLLAFLTACTEVKPASYPMRAALPFGTVAMSVQSTEASSDLSKQSILVHVRMENLEAESQARVASQSWDQLFKLVDRDGKKYKCHRFLPTDYYYENYHYGGRGGEQAWSSRDKEDIFSTVPKDWIMHFDVPSEAGGFTLLINNLTFHAGSQPMSIAVPLDR